MRFIKNGKVVLDGTRTQEQTEELLFKALEIIVDKCVDIGWLIRSENCSKYNLGVGASQALKRKEYEKLKEIM